MVGHAPSQQDRPLSNRNPAFTFWTSGRAVRYITRDQCAWLITGNDPCPPSSTRLQHRDSSMSRPVFEEKIRRNKVDAVMRRVMPEEPRQVVASQGHPSSIADAIFLRNRSQAACVYHLQVRVILRGRSRIRGLAPLIDSENKPTSRPATRLSGSTDPGHPTAHRLAPDAEETA